MLRSQICTQKQLESKEFQQWVEHLGERPGYMHRKTWEWCFITQALHERGLLRSGKTGLGFAVGREPLAAFFCSRGAKITATDLAPDEAAEKGWAASNQHAANLESINSRNTCPKDVFEENCSFQYLDMNNIPGDIGKFDFIWSSCSLEHLGSLKHGEDFIYNSMHCLKPGGVAIHTTEFNVSSNWRTRKRGNTVLYRKRDLQRIASNLKRDEHDVDIDFSMGDLPADKFIDLPPYKMDTHLRLKLGKYVITSAGLIIEKCRSQDRS